MAVLSKQFMKVHSFLTLLLSLLLLPACVTRSDDALYGSVLVWHSWEAEQAEVLDTVLDSFVGLYPDVNINAVYVPADRLLERYEVAAEAALGPDLMLAPSSFIGPLAEAGLIQPVGDLVGEGGARALPARGAGDGALQRAALRRARIAAG